jgi:hypothetical protein
MSAGPRQIVRLAGLFLCFWIPAASGAVAADATVTLRSWYNVVLELVRHTATYSPPVAARAFGYLGVGAYEAAATGSDDLVSLAGQLQALEPVPRREQGAAYDEAVIVNSVLSALVKDFFSNTGPTGQRAVAAAQRKYREQAAAGIAEDIVARSEAHGALIAAHILAWSETDGAVIENMGFPLEYDLPQGESHWVPTSAIVQQQFPLLPDWGRNRTFAAPSGSTCALAPPPAYSSEPGSDFHAEAMEVYEAVNNATPEQAAIARFWSDDPMLSTTPPGHWISIALQVAERDQLSLTDTVDVIARLGIAMSDAFVGCWHDKYVYNLIRPITYIKRQIDPEWEPILNTPPFPEYPSGHSTVSGAAAAVLSAFFGDDFRFDDATGSRDGRSARTFASFSDAAGEAALSRLFGGIHFRAAIENGLEQGRCIAAYTVALKTRR